MYDTLIADLRKSADLMRKVRQSLYMDRDERQLREAADAIEHLVRKVMELEDELGIYDELPLVDQREPLKEPCKRCHGKGYINVAIGVPGEPDSFQCGDCNGTGIARKEET